MFIGPEAQLPRVDAAPNESQVPFTEAQSQVVITAGKWEESAISRTQEVGVKDGRDREHSELTIPEDMRLFPKIPESDVLFGNTYRT